MRHILVIASILACSCMRTSECREMVEEAQQSKAAYVKVTRRLNDIENKQWVTFEEVVATALGIILPTAGIIWKARNVTRRRDLEKATVQE